MLAVGKYKTRGGVDAVIVAVVDGFAYGYRVSEGPRGSTTWDASSGRYFTDGSEDSWDLIDTKPRIKFERWATIYRDEQNGQFIGGLHETLRKAKLAGDNSALVGEGCIAIARVEIDCTEGENLD